VARVAKPDVAKADGEQGLAPAAQFESPMKTGTTIAQDTSSPVRSARTLPSTPEGTALVSDTIHKALSRAAAHEHGDATPTTVVAVPESSEMGKEKQSKPNQALLQGLVSSDMLHRIRQRDKVRTCV
jgi:hypothetical protein